MADDKEYVNRLEAFAVNQADEIERLRAEITRWKELAADLAMQCAINEIEGGDA